MKIDKDALVKASKDYIREKYGDVIANSTEYGYSEAETTVTSRITDHRGRLIGYITSWIDEKNTIQHYIR